MDLEELSEEINRPLSADELMKLVPGAKIVTYDELMHLNDIDEILYPLGKCFILYMIGENFGHWVCLYLKKGVLNFFDSYGSNMDNFKVFENVPNEILVKKNETYSWLSQLMKDSRYPKINYNHLRLQGVDTATCGRFCALRLLSDLSDKKFYEFMNSTDYTPDAFSVILTHGKEVDSDIEMD